jgi:hypothetical protein
MGDSRIIVGEGRLQQRVWLDEAVIVIGWGRTSIIDILHPGKSAALIMSLRPDRRAKHRQFACAGRIMGATFLQKNSLACLLVIFQYDPRRPTLYATLRTILVSPCRF